MIKITAEHTKIVLIISSVVILMVLRKIFKSHEKMNLKLIEHKTVVVTGASSGIGASYVKYFAEHGFDVIMTARRQKNMEEIKESLKHCNVKITVFPSDLQTDEGVNSLVKFVRDYNQPIGAFVSNAGIAYFPVDFTDSPREEYTKIINLHVNKTTDLIQKIGQLFKEQKSGVFVQVASGLGIVNYPMLQIYSATKAYLVSLIRSVNQEAKAYGVKYIAVCPLWVATPMTYTSKSNFFFASSDRLVKDFFCGSWANSSISPYWVHRALLKIWLSMSEKRRMEHVHGQAKEAQKRLARKKASLEAEARKQQ
ncbi:Oxidoreductase [Hexamita inflata]|uniref:Oxidoreductase n=1 Tax=Hexamita inflata TaxID=28002 RepID=A0AA86QDX7_9EUKA|nr:Oxidoreductase [Hexamita inflata]